VSATFEPAGAYRIEIVTDASSLLEKLQTAAGDEPDAPGDRAGFEKALRHYEDVFEPRLGVAFDDQPLRSAVGWSVAMPTSAAASPIATIEMTGTVPQGAKRFTWTFPWTFATYALTTRCSGTAAEATEWLEGAQASAPFSLDAHLHAPRRLDIAVRYL